MDKSEYYVFFWNYCSQRPQSWFIYSNKWVNEVKWVSKVKVIIWPWPKVTQISKLKLVFLGNYIVIWNKISFESLWVNGNENLYKWVGSHDQDGRHAHIWWKTLKKSSSPKPIDRWLEIWYVALCKRVLLRLFKLWPSVDLDLFHPKVKLVT